MMILIGGRCSHERFPAAGTAADKRSEPEATLAYLLLQGRL